MDVLIVIAGALCIFIGIAGSFLPVLPGVPLGWFGLLLLHLTSAVPMNATFLGVTLVVTIAIVVLDYFIPAIGTKRFGGSRFGVVGTMIGLIVGILSPIPFGFLIGPFVGAFIGEMLNKSNSKDALKAAFGSFLGFLASSFMSFIVSLIFAFLFFRKLYSYWEVIF